MLTYSHSFPQWRGKWEGNVAAGSRSYKLKYEILKQVQDDTITGFPIKTIGNNIKIGEVNAD